MPQNLSVALKISATLLTLLALLALPSIAAAQDSTDPLDWSIYEKRPWSWPFEELDHTVEKEDYRYIHHTLVRESPAEIAEYTRELKTAHESFHPDYTIAGVTHRTLDDAYILHFKKRHLTYSALITAEGAGSKIVFETTPKPLIDAYFHRALYPYRLGNGQTLPSMRADGRMAGLNPQDLNPAIALALPPNNLLASTRSSLRFKAFGE